MTDTVFSGLDVGDGTALAVGDGEMLEVDALFTSAPPPSVPLYTDDDYLAAFLSLMPVGRAWPRDPAAVQVMLIAGLAKAYTRVSAAAAALVADAYPATTVSLLAEWEASLGLPDPCLGPSPSLQVRQAQVVAKFISTGGQSVGYFIGLAALLGYPITITEYTAPDDPHHWLVSAPTIPEFYFRVGSSTVGEPLVSGGNELLECVIREQKPAQTSVSFHYGP